MKAATRKTAEMLERSTHFVDHDDATCSDDHLREDALCWRWRDVSGHVMMVNITSKDLSAPHLCSAPLSGCVCSAVCDSAKRMM